VLTPLATSRASAAASAGPLFIFQLPATKNWRMSSLSLSAAVAVATARAPPPSAGA
jgi:hypothetical protein